MWQEILKSTFSAHLPGFQGHICDSSPVQFFYARILDFCWTSSSFAISRRYDTEPNENCILYEARRGQNCEEPDQRKSSRGLVRTSHEKIWKQNISVFL